MSASTPRAAARRRDELVGADARAPRRPCSARAGAARAGCGSPPPSRTSASRPTPAARPRTCRRARRASTKPPLGGEEGDAPPRRRRRRGEARAHLGQPRQRADGRAGHDPGAAGSARRRRRRRRRRTSSESRPRASGTRSRSRPWRSSSASTRARSPSRSPAAGRPARSARSVTACILVADGGKANRKRDCQKIEQPGAAVWPFVTRAPRRPAPRPRVRWNDLCTPAAI